MKTLTDGEVDLDSSMLNEMGNSDFIKNFKNLDIEDYFKANKGENKVLFAHKYVDASSNYAEDFDEVDVVPSWIKEIKVFFSH
ncbi:hypothetical protein [Shewanella woodyi]|uniref:hypothetical protein n=1 Tax=Shewanella woodyi TaxID=60961 RepID=UPI003748A4B6